MINFTLNIILEFFKRAAAKNTLVKTMNILDDPNDVVQRGYDALMKGEY